MKTFLTKILALSGITLLILSGCKKSDVIVTSNGGKPGALTSSASTLVLSSARLTDTTKVITFTFTQANYGFSAAITNTLQIDKPGDNWVNPASATLATNVLTQGYNTSDFNNLLLKLGLVGGTTASVNVRIVQAVSNAVTPVYSNVLSLTVTPFNLTSWIYVVGAFQGWNASAPDSLESATSNGIYTGIINFTAGNNQFLILPAKNYNNKYATSQPTTATTTTVTYNAGNNLVAPATAGQYVVTFNINTGAISFGLADLYSVIGSSTPGGNYSTDLPLTKYVNDGKTGWTGIVAMTAGAFKIRQNDDWTYSWGDISPADGVDATDNNGANINVPTAGNYYVSFNIAPGVQGASPAASVPPSVTATYKLIKQ